MLHDLSHDQPQGSGADAAATGQRRARQEAIAQNPGVRTHKVLAGVPVRSRVVAESFIPP
jgi:hypothetical protein